MNNSSTRTHKLLNPVSSGAWILATLLVGCGGGGGNDAPPTQPTPPMSDLMAPALTDAEAQTYTVNVAITDLVFTNGGGGSLSGCSVSPALPAGLSVEPTSNSSTCRLTGTPTAAAEQATYTVTATNATNSNGATITITVVTDLTAPALANIDTAQTYSVGTAITPLEFTNSGGGSLTACAIADPALPAGLTVEVSSDTTTCQIGGTPTAETEEATYTVTATNATDSDTATVTITVNVAAPVLANVDEMQTYTVDTDITPLAFSNNGGGALTGCSGTLPEGLAVERTSVNASCQIIGTPTAASERATYTITATNATGSGNATVEITVNPPTPSLVAPEAQTYVVGEKIDDLIFTNEGGGSLNSCAPVPALPNGLTLERTSDLMTCVLSGNPTVGVEQSYTITATNATGSSEVMVAISINLFSLSLPSEQNLNLTIGQVVSIPFTNNGGGTLTGCTIDPALPVGLTADRVSGNDSCEITGTPLLLSEATDYTVTATNATGKGIVLFSLMVGNVFQPTVAISSTGSSATLSWTALDTANGYEVWRAEVGDGKDDEDDDEDEDGEQITRVRANTAETTHTDSGLTADTDYYYLIAECTALGCADPSNTGPVAIASLADAPSSATTQTELDGASGITTATIGDKIYALVASRDDDGVQIIEITDPTNPTPISFVSDTSGNGGLLLDQANDITAITIGEMTYALVASGLDHGVQIIDISEPSRPTPTGMLADGGSTSLENATEITTTTIGNVPYALVASQSEGFQLINISDQEVPTATGRLADDGTATTLGGSRHVISVTIDGVIYAFVAASNDQGVQILDISSTVSTPTAISSIPFAAVSASAVTAIDGKFYAIVTTLGTGGIQIFDISSLPTPDPVGSLPDDDQLILQEGGDIATQVIGGRTYALVASGVDDGVQIIDVSDPMSPTAVAGVADTEQTLLDGAVDIVVITIEERIYAITASLFEDGIQIIDVTTPQRVVPASN